MRLSDRLHRLRHFEYWPFPVFYLPVFLAWPWFALRARSLVFFTNANPAIPLGGSIEESKSHILRLLPRTAVAPWRLVRTPADLGSPERWPVVAKPDVGERGDHVQILHSETELAAYARALARPFLLQDYIAGGFEAGVMVVRDPVTKKIRVPSIVTKDFLSVTGDGTKSVAELVAQTPRARFQWQRLQELGAVGSQVPAKDEVRLLEPIGNHCRGTTFIDGRQLLTPAVQARVEAILADVEGIYFGRFDLKAPSAEAFARGEGWQILELNGAFSEPGHVYDPQNTLLSAWRDLVRHWGDLATVSAALRRRGTPAASFWEFMAAWRAFRRRTA